jgi:putative ATP-binding cassette transporter
VSPLYIRGSIEFGTVTQAAMAFGHVLGAFSLIVVEFQRITSFAAVVARLGSFEEVVDATLAPAADGIVTVADDTRIAFEELTLRTPREGRLLLDGLSLEVPEGSSLLITGPRGVGCSSLLRAAAGLWKHGAGRVHRPANQLLFLPQQSYLVAGSLRDQLLYTANEDLDDEHLMEVVRMVGLEPVWKRVGGLDAECAWENVLSRGEQQMLTFARLLLANPRFVFLDDATSALDPAWGRYLYELLAQQPITYISAGNDPDLRDYHDRVLELRGNGAWVLVPRAEVLTA